MSIFGIISTNVFLTSSIQSGFFELKICSDFPNRLVLLARSFVPLFMNSYNFLADA